MGSSNASNRCPRGEKPFVRHSATKVKGKNTFHRVHVSNALESCTGPGPGPFDFMRRKREPHGHSESTPLFRIASQNVSFQANANAKPVQFSTAKSMPVLCKCVCRNSGSRSGTVPHELGQTGASTFLPQQFGCCTAQLKRLRCVTSAIDA